MARFENTKGHYKFWEVSNPEVEHNLHGGQIRVEVRWGRIGTTGQSQVKRFGSLTAAQHFIQDKIQEKLDKGYVEKLYAPIASAPAPKPDKPHIQLPPPKVMSFADKIVAASLPLPPDLESVTPAPLGKVPIRPTAPKPVSDSDDLGFLEVLGL